MNLTVNKVIEEFYSNAFLSSRTISEVGPRLSEGKMALLAEAGEKVHVKPSLPISDVAAITG